MVENLENVKEFIKLYKDNHDLFKEESINLAELLDFGVLGIKLNNDNQDDYSSLDDLDDYDEEEDIEDEEPEE